MAPRNFIPQEDASEIEAIPFQFSDVRALASKILRRATEEAEKKIEMARNECTRLEQEAQQKGWEEGRRQGRAEGMEEGRAIGEAAARTEFQTKVASVVEALTKILTELQERRLALQAQAEADLLRLALAIAKRILRREIALDPRAVVPILREAIALANRRQDLILHLHPQDLHVVEEELPQLRSLFSDLAGITLYPDPAIERGGVLLVGQEGEIDIRIEEQIRAIEAVLVGKTQGEDTGERRGFPL